MERGGDVNDGFSMMDFGDEKWSVRKKTIIENGLSVRIFFHSSGQVSRQFIFQSLAESHKVPLGGGVGNICINLYQFVSQSFLSANYFSEDFSVLAKIFHHLFVH